MSNTITARLDEVTKIRHQNPAQVIAEAVEIGLKKMWVDDVLVQYLRKQIARRKAIRLVGLELVLLAEHQNKVTQEDIKWGLGCGTTRH